MVMHARKQPRVNDGYTERKDAHLHQWLDRHQQRGNGGKYSDRSPAEGSHSRHSRTDSPGSQPSPRYHNKVAYLERHKDKRGSLHLAEEKVSQYLATGSIGERAPPNYGDYDEHEPDRHSDGSHGHDREASRRGETKEEREHRLEVQKSAVRVCGDWSEHISSSGKRYYYNCQTEVSQWEKPKEWIQSAKRPERTRDSKAVGKSTTSTSADRRHSITSEQSEGRNPAYHAAGDSSSYSGTPQRTSEHRQWTDVPRGSGGTPHYQESGSVRKNSAAAETYSSSSYNHKGQSGGYSGYPDLKRNNVHAESCVDEPARQRPKVDGDSGQRTTQRREAIQTLQEFQKALSLHINRQQTSKGPSQSATSSSMGTSYVSGSEQSQFPQVDSYGYSLQHNEQPQYSPHNHAHHLPQQASCSSAVAGEEGPLRDTNHYQQQYQPHGKNQSIEQDGGDSPVSELSPGTSCHSPTPSLDSPPVMPPIGTSALSAAALKSQQAVGLSPALSNYYNEKLIGHVLGWQGEHIEKQAERFHQEALLVGSLSCSQVCVNLKRARSNVRTAEIQSTIHEQRLLMLQQQRQEIENLKPPTNLLASSS